MLIVNSLADCNECIIKRRVEQPDGTEKSEKFVCEEYPDGIPPDITLRIDRCRYKKPE